MGFAQTVAPRGTRRRRWAEMLYGAVRPSKRPSGRTLSPLDEERAKLKRSWAKHPPYALDEYLVIGYQSPRVNAQSMLVRHFLIRRLFGSEFDVLMDQELQHCVKATEALREHARELGVKMGSYLNPERRAQVKEVSALISDWEDAYERRWTKALEDRAAASVRVLEFACGSANDYRFFDSYGLARFLDYTGVDLNDANIENAHRRFPDVNFEVRDVLHLPYDDQSFDYVVISNLLEHLSLRAMEHAVAEACRLAKKGLIITLFQMVDEPEHTVRPVRSYFKNTLSRPKLQELLEKNCGPVEAIRIRDLLRDKFDYGHSYNKIAWTMIAERHDAAHS